MTKMGDEPILIGGFEKREIRIVDYDPEWPAQYETHAKIIAVALSNALMRVEHIGSTSVPGLAAKPIIDILAVVEDSADEASYVPKLEAAGYALRVREPNFYEHRMFRTSARDVHVHVYSLGTPDSSLCHKSGSGQTLNRKTERGGDSRSRDLLFLSR